MILIISLPFLFFTYNLAPFNSQIWRTRWFVIDTNLSDVNFFLWLLSVKVLTLSILSIWFITCKNWWRYVLLIPFCLEIDKIINVIDASFYDLSDAQTTLERLLIFLVFVLLILIIDKLISYSFYIKNINEELNEEIAAQIKKLNTFDSKVYKTTTKDFMKLKKEKSKLNKKEYLIKLIILRDKMGF